MVKQAFPQLHSGQEFGEWKLVRCIGRGGNGQVWHARANGGDEVALKLLTKVKDIPYARFRTEVEVMRAAGLPGIVPILKEYLPDKIESSRPWYAMPLGRPLHDQLEGQPITEIAGAIASVAESLAALHARSIFHRDIKPANLLSINERPAVADFGLVSYPEKDDLTGPGESIGPRWTMAPEVRRLGNVAEPGPADVYSLAKTLWILATGVARGFDGQYASGSSVQISADTSKIFLRPLEDLLTRATDHDPKARPSMLEFATGITEWLRLQETWGERNTMEWAEVRAKIFPVAAPQKAEWRDIDEVVLVLNVVGQRSNLNHLFFPSGGGMDMEGATRSVREPGCIELDVGYPALLKPKRLLFENLGLSPEWNYFWLEAEELEVAGVYAHSEEEAPISEEVLDLGGRNYVDRIHADYGEYEPGLFTMTG